VSFQWPLALVALVIVPTLVAAYVLRERRKEQDAARFTTPALLPNLVDSAPGWRRHLPLALFLLALAAMVVGVARPHAMVNVQREEATVILAIDTSLSMRADDVRPTRLAAARKAAGAFLDELPEKFRVGVVGFSGRAYVALPPTEDRVLARSALRSLQPGEGTSLGDAVALATQLGRRQRGRDGTIPPTAILVISDGAQMSGRTTPEAAAQRARALRIPVYGIVVGTDDGIITVELANGFQAQIRVPPNPDTVRLIARMTGGRLFTSLNDDRLRQIYEKLGSRLGHRRESREITDFFAGGSAALLLVGGALSAFWFRRVP
jgi:Ca-activated chloride channel family protein